MLTIEAQKNYNNKAGSVSNVLSKHLYAELTMHWSHWAEIWKEEL